MKNISFLYVRHSGIVVFTRIKNGYFIIFICKQSNLDFTRMLGTDE